MGIYRGAGGSGDAVNDASSEALITVQAKDAALAAQAAAEAARDAAQLAETNAETAETNAETAETNAETAATNAASSASAASTSASNAATSATNAANSATAAQTAETNAETAETNAAASASAASTSASNAATSATNASNSASAAATSATNASNSASAAATSATNAANSATAAQTAQTAAELAETNAETAEANAETAEANAAVSASAAATSESNAANSASAAATSATNASNSASAAATSATNASNSASAAATSASNAATSESNAASSATAAAASYDSFDDRYLGAKSSAPTLDNDGNTLLVGALYFDTVTNFMKVWDGSSWLDAYASLSGALLAANNLSDLANAATARDNLGVEIGVDVQAYDADTAKLDVAQSWSAAQSFNAGVTLGDASGDALTINSSAVSIPNGLNFDSNTFVIDATNNRVGVGTAVPSYPLDVSGNFRVASSASNQTLINTGAYVSFLNTTNTLGFDIGLLGGASDAGAYIYQRANAPLIIATNNSERIRITSTGNVGIGTSSPSERLEVSGNLAFSTDAIIRRTTSDGSDNSYIGITGGGGLSIARGSQVVSFGNEHPTDGGKLNLLSGNVANSEIVLNAYSSSSVIRMLTNNTERMRIDSSGRMLLGNTASNNLPYLGVQFAPGFQNYATSGTGGFYRYSANSDPCVFTFAKSRNATIGSHTVVSVGDNLGYIGFAGSDGTNFITAASIVGMVDGTPGTNDMPGRLVFTTTADGASSPTERMRIDSSGNVGIGTSSPASRLDVANTFRAVNSTEVAPSSGKGIEIWYPSANDFGRVACYDRTGGVYKALYLDGSTLLLNSQSSGNVGIGTSSPNYKVTVNGGSSATAIQLVNASSGTGAADGLLIYQDGVNCRFQNTEAGASTFWTDNTERMRITSDGDLLVGTTAKAATEKLTVYTSSTITGWFQTTNSASSGVVNIYSVIPSTAFNTNCAHFAGQTASVNTWFLYGNGTTSYTSDANLKKNIVTTRDGYLDDVAKLRVVKYQWKVNPDDSPTELGLIAQEVAEVFPGLVKDSIPTKDGEPTNKVILGSVFQPILIKCVQELNSMVKEQQAMIEELKTRIETLENK